MVGVGAECRCGVAGGSFQRRWVRILSEENPTLAFHASITNPFGKGALIQLLRQFQNLHRDKKNISVGFVGYPNVGKSSIINTLRGNFARLHIRTYIHAHIHTYIHTYPYSASWTDTCLMFVRALHCNLTQVRKCASRRPSLERPKCGSTSHSSNVSSSSTAPVSFTRPVMPKSTRCSRVW